MLRNSCFYIKPVHAADEIRRSLNNQKMFSLPSAEPVPGSVAYVTTGGDYGRFPRGSEALGRPPVNHSLSTRFTHHLAASGMFRNHSLNMWLCRKHCSKRGNMQRDLPRSAIRLRQALSRFRIPWDFLLVANCILFNASLSWGELEARSLLWE